jgi:hypothetical protein
MVSLQKDGDHMKYFSVQFWNEVSMNFTLMFWDNDAFDEKVVGLKVSCNTFWVLKWKINFFSGQICCFYIWIFSMGRIWPTPDV